MSFNETFNKYAKKYDLIEEEDPMQPDSAGDAPPASPEFPAQPVSVPPTEPEPLTSEGKRYVIDVARKALLWDSNQIPMDTRSELANNDVTPENAERVLELIEDVVSDDVPRAEEEI